MDVALASCLTLPEPDPDQDLLEEALRSLGLSAATWAWDDPCVDWSQARLCVIRSTWNYPRHVERFLQWVEAASRVRPVWNPPAVVHANIHKRYLLELERRGIPVVPTRLVRRGSPRRLHEVAAGWQKVVVKPAISAASLDTIAVEPERWNEGDAHLQQVLRTGDALVQPYLDSVERGGERALVWIDGQLTHAVRKQPRFAGQHESVSAAVEIQADERRLALAALGTVGHPLLYARVDVAPGPQGAPVVMELELIEPSLFLQQHRPALQRLAAAIARVLDPVEHLQRRRAR